MSIKSRIKTWWDNKTLDEKFDVILKGIATIGMVGGAIYCGHTLHEDRKLIEHAVSNIGDRVDICVSDELVESAVNRAAAVQTRRIVESVTDKCSSQIRNETKEAINDAVRDTRRQITDQVSDRLAEACKKMDEREIMDEIKKKSVDALTEKLDKNLDAITDEYSKNLESMGKVYTALADKLQSKA